MQDFLWLTGNRRCEVSGACQGFVWDPGVCSWCNFVWSCSNSMWGICSIGDVCAGRYASNGTWGKFGPLQWLIFLWQKQPSEIPRKSSFGVGQEYVRIGRYPTSFDKQSTFSNWYQWDSYVPTLSWKNCAEQRHLRDLYRCGAASFPALNFTGVMARKWQFYSRQKNLEVWVVPYL
jgi:hypothetical protein